MLTDFVGQHSLCGEVHTYVWEMGMSNGTSPVRGCCQLGDCQLGDAKSSDFLLQNKMADIFSGSETLLEAG
jgi:hypothetical protein